MRIEKEWAANNNFVICDHEVIAECISADMASHIAACHNQDQATNYSQYKNNRLEVRDLDTF